jgi:predicted TIM-barrel fold metal-dependent hydrolase
MMRPGCQPPRATPRRTGLALRSALKAMEYLTFGEAAMLRQNREAVVRLKRTEGAKTEQLALSARVRCSVGDPQAGPRSSPGPKGIDADYLVAQLDAAGISRAVVLSVAYSFSNPNKAPVPNEYSHVMDENNWTSAQVAKYPHRLLGFCSVNPLRPYALQEITRYARDPNLRTGHEAALRQLRRECRQS